MNGNKEIKIFKEFSYKELPDYRYKQPDEPVRQSPLKQSPLKQTKSSPPPTRNISRNNSNGGVVRVLSMCDTNKVTERTNAQTIQDELDRTVEVITQTVSFSSDVFAERAAEHYGSYKCSADLFAVPSGLKKAGIPACFYNSRHKHRTTPVSHLPCILRDCFNSPSTASQSTGRQSKRIDKSSQSLCGVTPSQTTVPSLDSRDYEDEIILSNLSPSTVELIVSRMTHGLQQDRLRKKFQIAVKPCAEPDAIKIY